MNDSDKQIATGNGRERQQQALNPDQAEQKDDGSNQGLIDWHETASRPIIEYLRAMESMITQHRQQSNKASSDRYQLFEEFVLHNGRSFEPMPFPSKYRYRGYHAEMKACYRNAYLLARHHPDDLRYAEGYAIACDGSNFPFMHAWCVDREDRVVDPTWGTGIDYFGVIFDMDYAAQVITAKGEYGVLDNWKQHFPLLNGEHTDWRPKLMPNRNQRSRT